jgi:hypothetical protein
MFGYVGSFVDTFPFVVGTSKEITIVHFKMGKLFGGTE